MTYYSLTARSGNSYTLPYQSVGNLLTESGDVITTEAGDAILLENPNKTYPDTSRNSSSYSLPSRN